MADNLTTSQSEIVLENTCPIAASDDNRIETPITGFVSNHCEAVVINFGLEGVLSHPIIVTLWSTRARVTDSVR